MCFPDYFADAEATFENSDYVIFGVPYDKTSTFRRGADKAPREIRKASWNFETYDMLTNVDLKNIKIHDHGDLQVDAESKKMIETVENVTRRFIKKRKFPIAIGGEHSITVGTVKAFPVDTAVLILDAHLDFRDEYENNPFNHACVTRRIADFKKISDLAVLGVRSAEKKEYMLAREKKLFFRDALTVKKHGVTKTLREIKKRFAGKKIYLSIDMDVVDPGFAPGTSTPEPFGLTPLEVIECIDPFVPDIIGFDIVEVCPAYDNGETSILASKIVRYVIEKTFVTRGKRFL